MDLGIKGKRALVCGASEGMGRAIAISLYAEGADVFVCSRSEDKLKDSIEQITKAGKQGRLEHLSVDLSDAKARQHLVAAVKEKFGGVDILVHNTGGPKPSSVQDTAGSDWQTGFDSLFQSVAYLNEAFLPDMKSKQWGRIICVTSTSVLEPIKNLAISNAMRSAVTAMMKTLSDEVAAENITVNCVAPGSIATGRIDSLVKTRAAQQGKSVEHYHQEYVNEIPAKRLGTPEEFAAVVTFLASEKASYVTGSTICVDGGRRRSTY